MSEAPGPLNFTMFLTLFGEKLTGEWEACQPLLGCGSRLGHLDGQIRAPVVYKCVSLPVGRKGSNWECTVPCQGTLACCIVSIHLHGFALLGIELVSSEPPHFQVLIPRMSFEMHLPALTRKVVARSTRIGE